MTRKKMDKEREKIKCEAASDAAEAEFDSGYSEKEQALDIEIRAGEWQNLKKLNSYKNKSRQGKVFATFQAVSNKLNQLVVLYYKLINENSEEAAKILKEIQSLEKIHEMLLNHIMWNPKGDLKRDVIPKEIWNLIE